VSSPLVLVHPDGDVLAAAVAARLITRLVDAQSDGGVASIVLTGGSIARVLHRAVREHPARAAVDWSRVEVWWGDERFVPAADPERNEGQARADLLDDLPIDPARVHPMPSSDGAFGDDVDAAAAAYADQLADADSFDVLMLGMGPDGHVALLFPGHAGADDERPALAVRASPKPPPVRISMSFDTLARADEAWVLVSGEGKADAVARALAGDSVPAARVRGRQRTLWFLDQPAAARIG